MHGHPETNGGDMKKRRAFGIAAIAMALVVALFAAGCGDKTAELSKAVTGIWRVEKSGGTDLTTLEEPDSRCSICSMTTARLRCARSPWARR